MNLAKNTIGYLVIFFIIFLLIELASYSVIYVFQNKYPNLYFDPSLISETSLKKSPNYSNSLGWITDYEERDVLGGRIDSNVYQNSCIDMFGDSFTYSSEVNAEDAWPKKLGELLKCKVHNYGVSGYGSDQATMRHQETKPSSKIVVLNHLSENIMRNVNQLRNLLYPDKDKGTPLKLKPRYFITKDGKLKKIPIPNLSIEDTFSSAKLNEQLTNEYFLPGGESGIREMNSFSFPYTYEMIHLISRHYRVKTRLQGIPMQHHYFYNNDHPSGALTLTHNIFLKFIDNAHKLGQKPIVTIIPTCRELKFIESNRIPSYQSLLDKMTQSNITHFDFTKSFLSHENYRTLFDKDCTSHPNVQGYLLMARAFKDYISKLQYSGLAK